MSQSDYGDLICFEELNRADQDEMVMVVYVCADAVRGRDPNSEMEDTITKRILQTGRITLMYFMSLIQSLRCGGVRRARVEALLWAPPEFSPPKVPGGSSAMSLPLGR
ncbi:hypothetical protein SRHO_G00250310 [Serrasalmus rhombeus]